MQLSVGAFNKELGFGALAVNILLIAVFVPVFIGIAVLLLRKQER